MLTSMLLLKKGRRSKMSASSKSHEKRKERQRAKLRLINKDRARLSVNRTNQHIYAQIVKDGVTLASASTLSAKFKETGTKSAANIDAAKVVGRLIAEEAKSKSIELVAFDRSGFLYHGCIKALADGAREAGLQF